MKSTGAAALTNSFVKFQTWNIFSTFSLNWRVKQCWISWEVQAVTPSVKLSNTLYTKRKQRSTGRRIGLLQCSSFLNHLLLNIPTSTLGRYSLRETQASINSKKGVGVHDILIEYSPQLRFYWSDWWYWWLLGSLPWMVACYLFRRNTYLCCINENQDKKTILINCITLT